MPRGKKRPEQEGFILYVMELMRKLEFRRGETGKILAEKWQIPSNRVRFICNEASKRVCAEVANPQETERDVGVALSEGIREAFKKKDWKTVGELSRTMANIQLARPAQKIEVNNKNIATASAAATAVKEFFSDKVTNDADKKESSDGAKETRDPPN